MTLNKAPEKPSPFESLKISDFRNFIAARFFLVLAIQMQMTTLGLQVYYEHGRSELALGMISLYEAIPFIINSFYSGYVADRFNRKRIILICVFVLMLGSVFLVAYCKGYFPALKDCGYTPLIAVVILFGVVRAFIAASANAFMSQLVPRHLYTNSATWNSTVWHVSSMAGPVLAAYIYGYKNGNNAAFTYMANAGLFISALLFFAFIKNKPKPAKKEGESIMDSLSLGLRFVFKNKVILSALSLDLFAVLFGGAVAILPAFNDKILHQGPEALGLLRTAPAIGAVIMAFFMALRPPSKNAGKLLLGSVIAFGLFTLAFALCTSYWPAFVFLLLTGAVDNVSVVIRHSILQLMTPDDMRGRVSAVNGIFIGSSNEIGGFESGATAKLFGLVPSIIVGGCAVIAVVFGVNLANKSLKKLDLNKI